MADDTSLSPWYLLAIGLGFGIAGTLAVNAFLDGDPPEVHGVGRTTATLLSAKDIVDRGCGEHFVAVLDAPDLYRLHVMRVPEQLQDETTALVGTNVTVDWEHLVDPDFRRDYNCEKWTEIVAIKAAPDQEAI